MSYKHKTNPNHQNKSTFLNSKNTMLNLIQVLFLFSILFIKRVSADLPVHCLRSDVLGFWTLRVSTRTFTPSLQNELQTSCGHNLPNRVIDLQNDSDLDIPDYKEIKIELREDFMIFEAGKAAGTWTFVYDQSFILYYKNAILTAPFKYYKKSGAKDAESNCSKTFLGWYIPDTAQVHSNWSCFYAIKETEQAVKSFNFLQIDFKNENKQPKNFDLNEFIIENVHNKKSFSFVKTEVKEKSNTYINLENLLKYEHMSKIVDKLNKLDLGWTADVHQQYVGMSFAELKHKLGLNKGKYGKKSLFDDNTSFIQIGNKNGASAIADKKAEEDSVEEFLNNIDKELNFISIDIETEKSKSLLEKNSIKEQVEKSKIKNQFENEKANILNNSKETESTYKNASSNKSFLISNTKMISTTKGNLDLNNIEEYCCAPQPNISSDSYETLTTSSNSNSYGRDKDGSEVKDYIEITKYLQTDILQIDENKLSKNWDWRNIGGISFVPPVRSQGSCGSCYVFSTMSSLEARLRIQTNNKDQTLFSKQFLLSCNFYSEGCDGGYPVLVAKFLQEFEAIPESCFEYTEKNNKCSNACDYSKNKKKYTVSKWGYLGGAYGKTSEADMMKELRARGPIPGNMLVHWSFSYYKNGIFSSQAIKKNNEGIQKLTLLDSGRTWAKVEHSITLVGYGEENGVKYWIGMNTWGTNWGENGFFKILRGVNELEIESMGDSMNIKVEDRY
jgi:C1A family cysteine protease